MDTKDIMFTLEELQALLDKEKWYVSEDCHRDMSGMMIYCENCPNKGETNDCLLEQEKRSELKVCAEQYNKIFEVPNNTNKTTKKKKV